MVRRLPRDDAHLLDRGVLPHTMPIESKTKNLNWPSLQGTLLGGGAYTLERFASGDENSATFETHTGGQRGAKALVRLAHADEEAAGQQLQVWQAIKRSGHPNLIPIWGAGRARINGNSLIYVVVEASDENLAKVLEERALEPTEAGEILVSLVGALGHLHSHGFVHGALSPEQVLAVGESVKVSTGAVRRIGRLERLDFYQPKYRAPESSDGNISPAADVWCLGATLLQALTQRVCDGDCLAEAAKLPAPFDAIATSCLQQDPVARGTLAHLLALYAGTAKTAVASSAGVGTKTMAAAAGSGRGAISFDWDTGDEPEPKRETVTPVYLAPGPIVPEAEAFAVEASAGPPVEAARAVETKQVADGAVVPEEETVEKPVPGAGTPAAVSAPENVVAREEASEEAATPTMMEAETQAEEKTPVRAASFTEEIPEEVAFISARPFVPEGQVEEAAARPIAAAPEPPALSTDAPAVAEAEEVAPAAAEMPAETIAPPPAWTPTTPREERYSPDVNEPDPVAAANARLAAWREAAAAATRSQGERIEADTVHHVAGPDEIMRAKRRAWVFVGVALLILLAVVWVLRPSRSANKKAAESAVQTAQQPAATHGQAVHGRTMTLPAVGQNGQPETAVTNAPKSSGAQRTSPARETAPTAAAKAEENTKGTGPAGPGPVWRVILYTYNREADATKRVATINRRHPELNAEVFTPHGAGKSPFLVSIGGSTDRNVMTQLRHSAVKAGLPRDSYLQNYSR